MASSIRANLPFVITALAAALLAVGVLTFAGPCVHEDGSPGSCFGASQAVLAAAVASLVFAIAGIAVPNKRIGGALGLAAACAGIVAAASPGGLFGMCMVQTMRCWTIMRPFSLVLGVVIALCGIVAAVMCFRAQGRHAR